MTHKLTVRDAANPVLTAGDSHMAEAWLGREPFLSRGLPVPVPLLAWLCPFGGC